MFFDIGPKWLQVNPQVPQVMQKRPQSVQNWPQKCSKVVGPLNFWHGWGSQGLLGKQNMSAKWMYSAYGPVWVAHEAIWYALHVPFDVYMPLLASLSSLSAYFRRVALDTSKYVGKMNIFCLWTRLGRARSDMICITCASRRLYATFGVHFSLSGSCLPHF